MHLNHIYTGDFGKNLWELYPVGVGLTEAMDHFIGSISLGNGKKGLICTVINLPFEISESI